jgi:hypothetical protein
MKKTMSLLPVLMTAILLAFVSGCATAQKTENLLSAAGFKTQPAATAEQLAHLRSLPSHKLTPVTRDGKRYFVYPDAAHNVLYIGQNAQYEEYKKLRTQFNQREDEELAPETQMVTQWSVWGGW